MNIKKICILLATLIIVLAAPVFTASAAGGTVVFLKGGAQGSGASADDAVGTLEDAFNALDLSKDCTIVLCGEFPQSTTFVHTDKYTGSVTVTSVYDGVDYRNKTGAVYMPGETRFVCTGAVTFRDIDFFLQGKYFYIIAQHNPLVIDTGVTIQSMNPAFDGTAFATGFDICGGYQKDQVTTLGGSLPPVTGDENVNVTVRSGSNIVIAAYSRQIKEPAYSGKAVINIEGTAEVGVLYFAPVNTTFSGNATVEINVKDDAHVYSIVGGTNNGTIDKLTLNWESGEIDSFARATRTSVITDATNGYFLNYSKKVADEATFFPLIILEFDTITPTYKIDETSAPNTEEAPSTDAPNTDAPQTSAPKTEAPKTEPTTNITETNAHTPTEPATTDQTTVGPGEPEPKQVKGSAVTVAAVCGISVVAVIAVILIIRRSKTK